MADLIKNGHFNVDRRFLLPYPGVVDLMNTVYPTFTPTRIERIEPLSNRDDFDYINEPPVVLRQNDGLPYSPMMLKQFLPSGVFRDIRVDDTVYTRIAYYERGVSVCEVSGWTIIRSLSMYDQAHFKFTLLRNGSYTIDKFEFWEPFLNKVVLTKINFSVYISPYGVEIDSTDSYFLNEEYLKK